MAGLVEQLKKILIEYENDEIGRPGFNEKRILDEVKRTEDRLLQRFKINEQHLTTQMDDNSLLLALVFLLVFLLCFYVFYQVILQAINYRRCRCTEVMKEWPTVVNGSLASLQMLAKQRCEDSAPAVAQTTESVSVADS